MSICKKFSEESTNMMKEENEQKSISANLSEIKSDF